MVSKFKLGSITGALLASTLYSGATANADTTTQATQTTAVQTPSADTQADNAGSLTITAEADSATDSQQQASATSVTDAANDAADQKTSPIAASNAASDSASSDTNSDSKAPADSLSASTITTKNAGDSQTASQSSNGNDKTDKQADSDNSKADLTASSVTDSSSTLTVNLADLLEGSSAQTSSSDNNATSDTQTYTATLQYYDIINDKVVAEKVVQGEKGSSIDLDFPLPEGYTYAVDSSDLQMPAKWKPGVMAKWPSGGSSVAPTTYRVPVYRKEDLTRTITRTINVHKPTGMETIKQPVVYVSKISSVLVGTLAQDFMVVPFSLPLQDKTEDFETWNAFDEDANYEYYKVTVSAAQPDGTTDWAEFDAPEIEGYTVSQAVVSKVAVAPTDSDVTVDIYYTPKETEPETPTNPQPEEPTTPTNPQPEEPKADEPKPEEPQAEDPVTPATPETPKEEQPAVIESNAESAAAPVSTEPVQPAAVSNTDAQPTQLPQTGNERSNTMGITGAVSAMIGSLLAFAGKKKRCS
ncbi:LPXTG cell wall anchor domain-containing protein [Limosilactobacillus mucosae]|uniref:LPXTG cell wall anchor domain-containing protein n=1 Tax=Limosilactobacillus mucosae TaxID=97478 RepID=A0AAJ1HR05_LIMMU|nr:LPXTG cell wall anchor domain-containing protein [Limosilactobacillus mucosae]MDC2828952.1 LPXTG cell wall anchor domain-containing protein [Limosilactobacillus mucosae]